VALETPNAILASAVVYIDYVLPIGERITLRSQNGILRKLTEVLSGPDTLVATFELENPIAADEAAPIVPGAALSAMGPLTLLAWISPLAAPVGNPDIDNISDNLLVLYVQAFPGSKSRSPLAVIAVPPAR
jgi:hypothetical protein